MSQYLQKTKWWPALLCLSAVFLMTSAFLGSGMPGVDLTSLPGIQISSDEPWSGRIQKLSWVLMLVGLFMVAAFSFMWPDRADIAKRCRNVLPLIVVVGVWGGLAFGYRSALIEGQRYFWLADDMMISMRYARNLVDGLGLVWNPGEYVEGYTNLMWVLLMAPGHLLGLSDRLASLPMIVVNLGCAVGLISTASLLIRQLGGGSQFQLLAVCLLLGCGALMTGTVVGFEQVLQAWLVMAVLVRINNSTEGRTRDWLTPWLIALLPLVRIDGALLSIVLGLLWLWVSPNSRQTFLSLCVAALLPLSVMLWRHSYYGDWFPNTYYLKTAGWSGRYAAGVHYVWSFLKATGLLWILALVVFVPRWRLTVPESQRALTLLIVLFMQIAYTAYVGGDSLGIFRMLLPVLPLLIVLAVIGLVQLRLRPVVVLPVIALLMLSVAQPQSAMGLLHDTRKQDVGNIEIGLHLLRDAQGKKVADGWAGSVFYFGRNIIGIDLLGKMDPVIARQPVRFGGQLPGHNKFDYEYSLSQERPDYLIALSLEDKKYVTGALQGDLSYLTHFWASTAFQQHCKPYRLSWRTLRPVYSCKW